MTERQETRRAQIGCTAANSVNKPSDRRAETKLFLVAAQMLRYVTLSINMTNSDRAVLQVLRLAAEEPCLL